MIKFISENIRRKFKSKFKKNPIGVLIPAYNSSYIEQTIFGLKNQTYKNFDVYISDDSPNQEITKKIYTLEKESKLDGINFHLIRGPQNDRLNQMMLDAMYSSNYKYIHFHLDDDYIYPSFYEEHLKAHSLGDFSVSISKRWLSNENNVPFSLPHYIEFKNLYNTLEISHIAKTCLLNSYNWLGEFSNMVFKPDGKTILPLPPKLSDDLNYYGILDIGSCLENTKEKNAIFLANFLSNFRQHSQQSTHNDNSGHGTSLSRLAWLMYPITAHNSKLITDSELKKALKSASKNIEFSLKKFKNLNKEISYPIKYINEYSEINLIKKKITEWWINFLKEDGKAFYEESERIYKK